MRIPPRTAASSQSRRCAHQALPLVAAGPDVQRALSLFGVGPDATERELRRRWHRLAASSHPDVAGGERGRFEEVRAAFELVATWRGFGRRRQEQRLVDKAAANQFRAKLSAAVTGRDRERLLELREEAVHGGYLCFPHGVSTLPLLLDGAAVVFPLSAEHVKFCLDCVCDWEAANPGETPDVDCFNQVLYCYAFLHVRNCDDSLLVTSSVTCLVEAMQARQVAFNWWTNMLIEKALRGGGKFLVRDRDRDDAASWLHHGEATQSAEGATRDYGDAYGAGFGF